MVDPGLDRAMESYGDVGGGKAGFWNACAHGC